MSLMRPFHRTALLLLAIAFVWGGAASSGWANKQASFNNLALEPIEIEASNTALKSKTSQDPVIFLGWPRGEQSEKPKLLGRVAMINDEASQSISALNSTLSGTIKKQQPTRSPKTLRNGHSARRGEGKVFIPCKVKRGKSGFRFVELATPNGSGWELVVNRDGILPLDQKTLRVK